MKMIRGLLVSARPRDWVKNGIVIAAWIDAGLPFTARALMTCLAVFVLLSAISSAVYLINDVVDRERDLQHPEKKFRPIPSSQVPAAVAVVAAMLLGGGAIVGGHFWGVPTGSLLIAYFLIQLLYVFWLKHVLFIESILIALGFVIRLIVATVAIQSAFSPWLSISCFFTLLFMILHKRQYELASLKEAAYSYRPVLKDYRAALLNEMVPVFTACSIVFYAIYATLNPLTPLLVITIPFMTFGILRYRHVAEQPDMDASGQKIFTLDPPTIINFLVWIAVAAALILTTR